MELASRAVSGAEGLVLASSKKMEKGSASASGVGSRGWRLGMVNAVAAGVRFRNVEVSDRAKNAVDRDGMREPILRYR